MAKKIEAKTTYILARRTMFHAELDFMGGGSPVAHGASIAMAAGTKMCVAQFGTTRKCVLMTTPVGGNAMYAWVDADEILTPDEAIDEGLIAHFAA